MQNVKLSSHQLSLVTDPQVLLTKNIILKKVIDILGEASHFYVSHATANLPLELLAIPPKISKGENYLGLPYAILDYPRNFAKDDMLAIRSFFWWGNYFSINLLLAGHYKFQLQKKLEDAIQSGIVDDWYIQTQHDKWNHNIDSEEYKMVKDLSQFSIEEFPFIKLSKKIPLIQWDDANIFFEENFKTLVEIISNK